MKSKTLLLLLFSLITINFFNIVGDIDECEADSVLPKFFVDDDAEEEWYNKTEHFLRIQDAIDNATNPGDRILVYAGIYDEKLTIDNDNIGISIFGEDKSETTIIGNGTDSVITISAVNVDVSSFTIKNCGSDIDDSLIKINASNCIINDNILTNYGYNGANGIHLSNCSNANIYYNHISNCTIHGIYSINSSENSLQQIDIYNNQGSGLYIENSNQNTINNNNIIQNTQNGVFCFNSSNNSFSNCVINFNGKHGIHFNYSCDNNHIITNCNVSENYRNGVFLNDHCDDNIITDSFFYRNCKNYNTVESLSGIRIDNSSNITLGHNQIINNYYYGLMIIGNNIIIHNSSINFNDKHGIFLFGDDNNQIRDNFITQNIYEGIRAQNSTNDQITGNQIIGNNIGLYFNYFSEGNLIWNNKFQNNIEYNSLDICPNEKNKWNLTNNHTGNNIINGENTNIWGNYWDDFDELDEGAIDTDHDGVMNNDCNKTIDISSYDYHPISDIINPVLDQTDIVFTTSQDAGGSIGLRVKATDNTEIKDVRLDINNPNNDQQYFSIFSNKSGDYYFCNKTFSVIGNYNFYIEAYDPPGNLDIIGPYSFNIHEGTPPTISDNSPAIAIAGDCFTFNVSVVSGQTNASNLDVFANWTHNGNSYSTNMSNIMSDFFEATIELDKSIANLTYHIYAKDEWENDVSTDIVIVPVVDNIPPKIIVDKHNYSFEGIIKTYTLGAYITDNTEVNSAIIEYWTNGTIHQFADMDLIEKNYYQKSIQMSSTDERIYCIINTTDASGNKNDTKHPFSNPKGPYTGVIGLDVEFDGSKSFDLDGEIINYTWNFGDGVIETGEKIKHSYSTNGNFTVTLTVTDNEGYEKNKTTYVNIYHSTKKYSTDNNLRLIENLTGTNLNEVFYAYDINGDALVDEFYDPNNVLKSVHSGSINLSGNLVFLISSNDDDIPEFIWNSTKDVILSIEHLIATKKEPIITADNIIMNVTIEKTDGWVYIQVNDPTFSEDYQIKSIIGVIKKNATINPDRVIRKEGKIFILDDPNIDYQIVYGYDPPILSSPIFIPAAGSTINIDNPTVKIIYNVAVNIVYLDFYHETTLEGVNDQDSTVTLTTKDNKTYIFTPPNNLADGSYIFDIFVKEMGNSANTQSNTINFYYECYVIKNAGFDFFGLIIPFIMLIIIFFGFVYLIKKKNLNFESFVYIKDKKILPFFKPLIFGPVRIDLEEKNVSKAEFFVNGNLKKTITQAPFVWDWNEKAFLTQKIEAKIYDEEGNSKSTGEMTFFVFNSPRFFN